MARKIEDALADASNLARVQANRHGKATGVAVAPPALVRGVEGQSDSLEPVRLITPACWIADHTRLPNMLRCIHGTGRSTSSSTNPRPASTPGPLRSHPSTDPAGNLHSPAHSPCHPGVTPQRGQRRRGADLVLPSFYPRPPLGDRIVRLFPSLAEVTFALASL